MTTFSINGAMGVISGQIVTVAMPYGTVVNDLIATFTSTGSSVMVGGTLQVSGSTANNFSEPVIYEITAADGSAAKYSVSVMVATAVPTANLAFDKSTTQISDTVQAILTLVNPTSTPISGGTLKLNLPIGFVGSDFKVVDATCKLSPDSRTNIITVTGVTIPEKSVCGVSFSIKIATLAISSSFVPTFVVDGRGTFASASFSTLTIVPNLPNSTTGYASGGYVYWAMQSAATTVTELNAYFTPQNDPGPNSGIFWAQTVGSIGGYFGMQTQYFGGAINPRKMFIFSLWGLNQFELGSPGSQCQSSATTGDGSAGTSCQYYYDWVPGHTYRLRISALGNSWYKVSVSDLTGGVASESFDIGSIRQTVSAFTGGKDVTSGLQFPATTYSGAIFSTFSEVFVGGGEKSNAFSDLRVYTSVVTTANPGVETFLHPQLTVNNSSTTNNPKPQTYLNISGNSAELIGGNGNSAQGFLVNQSGLCARPQQRDLASAAPGTNIMYMDTCPQNILGVLSLSPTGASSYIDVFPYRLVNSIDDSIRNSEGYCITTKDPSGSINTVVTFETCVEGAINQKWSFVKSLVSSGYWVKSKVSDACLDNLIINSSGNSTLTLQQCIDRNSTWLEFAKSFVW